MKQKEASIKVNKDVRPKTDYYGGNALKRDVTVGNRAERAGAALRGEKGQY